MLSALIAALMLAGCAPAGENKITLNVKVTAHALADGVPHEGSSVLEIKLRRTPNSLSGMAMSMKLKGEAVILDMGRDRTAYFLLKDYVHDILNGYDVAPSAGSVDETSFDKLQAASGVIDVPRKQYPKIAAFKDETDPATVYEVDPDDFADAFGPGVELTGLTLELVDEPMTEKIAQRLAWLEPARGGRLVPIEGNRIATKDASFGQLTKQSDFITLRLE
ncbi:hypothetical protein CW354_09875 [Marinicaulis flavus]|uniref:LppX_LprAFG lipoprotein n=2 Tax=Hyphococcus luteus TaxID=2058213 RepID=A0A2S7K7W9_9PROT|nr:hypothetical protein CW354_09875 [Marinicaulis flavus]